MTNQTRNCKAQNLRTIQQEYETSIADLKSLIEQNDQVAEQNKSELDEYKKQCNEMELMGHKDLIADYEALI